MKKHSMLKLNTYELVLCSLFVALTAVCSLTAIPIGDIPISLATFAIFITALLLGAKKGTIAILCFVLMGAIGIPIFANFRGGISVLAGPTGGYIMGYIPMAFVIGFLGDKFRMNVVAYAVACTLGLGVCYAFGTAWFMYSMQMSFAKSLQICVLPFLVFDAVKLVLAVGVALRVQPSLVKRLQKF